MGLTVRSLVRRRKRAQLCDPDPIRRVVFRVQGAAHHGTGFFVSKDGWALTCWHVLPSQVVGDPSLPLCVEWEGPPLHARFHMELSNQQVDIAVLKIDAAHDVEFPILPMAAMPPRLLRDLGICGMGFQEADRHKSSVEVWGSTYRHNAVRPIQIAGTQPPETQELLIIDPEGKNIEPGASGGPVIGVDSGFVVAMITARQRGQKWGHIEPAGRITRSGDIYIDEQYFREGYAIPLYEVFPSWPDFRNYCRVVGDVGAQEGAAPGSIGTYAVVREIGRGGFGTVYEVRDAAGLPLALKRFEPLAFRGDEQSEARCRFLRGAGIMQRLKHPNIPKVFEVNEAEAYMVMELANRASLDVFLRSRNATGQKVSFHTRVLWAIQLAAAVQYAHEQGVLHRDIAPSNVLVRENSAGSIEVLLSDFDLAFQRGRTQLSAREWNWRLYLPRPLRDELDRFERVGIREFSALSISRPGIDADLYSLSMVILYLFTEYEPGP